MILVNWTTFKNRNNTCSHNHDSISNKHQLEVLPKTVFVLAEYYFVCSIFFIAFYFFFFFLKISNIHRKLVTVIYLQNTVGGIHSIKRQHWMSSLVSEVLCCSKRCWVSAAAAGGGEYAKYLLLLVSNCCCWWWWSKHYCCWVIAAGVQTTAEYLLLVVIKTLLVSNCCCWWSKRCWVIAGGGD